ncbi:MAG: hypothetical protein ONB46_07180 [candidate division KSB1 bacterium]|nr:hypothetical protein [candidate division KSB1 bacterium]MDZ7368301.1 hypothetical protein [candidate division KSB1 bacterium]MDZ7406119.1 hypothetical protein [candidate division KSB1 bacterium]
MAGVDKLAEIAEGMLKFNEKIEQQVAGNYTVESECGNYEIVKGLLAATNHRVLVVLNKPLFGIRKDSFTYAQLNTVSMTPDEQNLSLVMPDEVIELYDLCKVDPCQEPEKFQKYVNEKKASPPKTTIMARDVEIVPPKK